MRSSEERFVALPDHPWYGHRVRVIRCRAEHAQTWCLIEDPAHPGFHYHMLEQWLTHDAPPPIAEPPVNQNVITLPMSALDRLVQLILIQDQRGRLGEDELHVERSDGTDLVPTTDGKPNVS